MSIVIAGAPDVYVFDVNPSTVTVEGCPAVRVKKPQDYVSQYTKPFTLPLNGRQCTRKSPDGEYDLKFRFSERCLYDAIWKGRTETRFMTLKGKTYGGEHIELKDVVRLYR